VTNPWAKRLKRPSVEECREAAELTRARLFLSGWKPATLSADGNKHHLNLLLRLNRETEALTHAVLREHARSR
jgi:hypothetical protein